jgi:DNA-binding transcriptional ArsR family regulator
MESVDAVLHALAVPTRREILALVRDQERSASDIASSFDVTRPAISQHLAVLKEAGLVDVRAVGTRRLYRARPQATSELRSWLDAFWADRLADLKYAIEEEHDGPHHRAR